MLRDGDYDVVVVANILAGTAVIRAANKYKVPAIFDLKDWFPDSAAMYIKNPLSKAIVRKTVLEITKYNLSHSTKITTVSPSLVTKLKTLGFESDLITNGVDTNIFKPLPKPKINGIFDTDFVIGFAGSVERWYGLDKMIGAMPRILLCYPKTKLLIVGGSLFTGYDKELKKLATELNVPLIPPKWRDIALPNKFFEYTACGKPILTTRIPDMIAMGTDNLRICDTMKDYIYNVGDLIRTPVKISNNSKQFSWNNKSIEFENVIKEVV